MAKPTRSQAIAALKAKLQTRSAPLIEVVAPPFKQPRELFLQIGSRRYQVASIEEAVAKHNSARDAADVGASQMPRVTIVSSTGLYLYTISYNGRVWDIDGKPLDGMTDEQRVARVTGKAA